MLLSILIPALESRPWQLIYNDLISQARQFSDVEVLVFPDDGTATSGVKRQTLVNSSKGDYICFVDDDDKVAPNYVRDIRTGCLSGVDVVTFSLEIPPRTDLINTRRSKYKDFPKTERWAFGFTPDVRERGLMTVNHLCAWKSTLAKKVAWCPVLGYADDQVWYQPLYHSGLVNTQYRINRVLYQYILNRNTSANQKDDRRNFCFKYLGKGLRCFWHGSEILIECGNFQAPQGFAKVRNHLNVESILPLNDLRHYYTISVK